MIATRSNQIAGIVERFRQGGNALIVSHMSPDGDSIGSQLALYELLNKLGCNPMIVNHDSAFPKYAFLTKHNLVNVYNAKTTYPKFEFAVILEAPDIDRVGDVRNLLTGVEVINIDHHRGKGWDTVASSVAAVVSDKEANAQPVVVRSEPVVVASNLSVAMEIEHARERPGDSIETA